MSRTFFAALLALVGLTSAAPAQVFYSGPTGYTTYYGPTYFHAPAYSPAYTSYSYTTGYRGGYGPLGILNPATWFGWRPYRSAAYTSPFYGSTYATAYSPSYSYTAGYSPLLVDTSTSYYAPAGDTIALASYETPLVSTASACCQPSCCPTSCCPTSCCQPCSSCASCATGNCPGGNCALNYAPSTDLTPKPDPNVSGSSGTRTFQNESNGSTGGASGSSGGDNFAPYNRNRPDDGYNADGSRRSGYGPREQKIQQKAPTNNPDDGTSNNGTSDAGSAEENKSGGPAVPADQEKDTDAAAPALNLDARVAAGPSLLRERLRMHARFGSPQLARAKVDPASLPAAADLRLVRK